MVTGFTGNPVGRHILLLCLAELRRIVLSRRACTGSLAFAIVWYLIFRYPVSMGADFLSNPNFRQAFSAAASTTGSSGLLQWPSPHWLIYWLAALYLYPIFAVYLGAQQLVPDIQSGFIRYLLLRTTRRALMLGRFAAHWLLVAALIVVTSIAATLMSLYLQTSASAWLVTGTALSATLGLVVSVAPFVALTSLVSTFARSPRGVLSLTFIVWFVWDLLISWAAHGALESTELARWTLGGFRLDWVRIGPDHVLSDLWRPVVLTGAILLVADWLTRRRAV
jgi:ABC-type transport system involved in multi-copper enzyme maturation permease subunit